MRFRPNTNLLLFILITCLRNFANPCCVNITVAYVTERASVTDVPFMINRTVGLIEIAMAKAKEIVKHAVNLNFLMRIADIPGCTPMKFGALVAETYHGNDLAAIIGPGCSNAVTPVARLAAAWNLPHISYGGTSTTLGNKTEFTTLTRLSFTMSLFAKFYMEVFNIFGWKDVANIYDSSVFLPRLAGVNLQESFIKSGVKSYNIPFKSKTSDIKTEVLRALTLARKVSRVFLVACHGEILRQLVMMARRSGMAPGEYTIIYFISDPSTGYIGNYGWERGDELDEEAKKAYESVLIVLPRRPANVEFLELEKTVIKQALVLYNYTWPKDAKMGILQLGQYDAFMLYAHALLKCLDAGEDPKNATVLNNIMWNATFPGLGGLVYVNENGDRDTDFSLQDMDPITGDFRTVAQYLGYTRKFELLTDVPVHWPNNAGPTLNKPKCGFVGELCISHEFPVYGSVIIAFAAVIIVLIVIGLYGYRRMQEEAAIQSLWWRIKWDDISRRTKSVMLSASSKNGEDESLSNTSKTRAILSVGFYKGIKVHIRKSELQSLTIDRKLLMELKEMRDVTCPNLTRLIGVCPEPRNVCIITEYCSRGSLQDILQNESIQLDKEFRLSLISDIVQGMHYLHTSSIGVHGRLCSSTCVIDSRFVLKITGFGLQSIYGSNIANEVLVGANTNPVFRDSAWIAPEILRTFPSRNSSKPGDVYSFAIILYEMCTRNEPYVTEAWYQSLQDTVDQIKSNRPKPRRPSFGNNDSFPEIFNLAIECWQEKPEERPTFSEIRKKIHSLRRENPLGNNVLDMLLHRMEQYANNLEGLVEDRTRAFLEEKKRSEELLYQVLPKDRPSYIASAETVRYILLPAENNGFRRDNVEGVVRSVADQLRVGHTVTPEAFETVTIYFSDIVGFTTISAASSPLQVVDFLNDVYTCFDGIIDNFDVYKVETIGDAYMVVSGLPVRNGNEHARHIARMSLTILRAVKQFVIKHQPETPLRARIGIHSGLLAERGPVVAGVVGRKMPRYCLFGDTVNTASRMESNGQPMMIHISDSARHLLTKFKNFHIEERGLIQIKGKGVMLTHWLIDEIMADCSEI